MEPTQITIRTEAEIMNELNNTSEENDPTKFEQLHQEWLAVRKENRQ